MSVTTVGFEPEPSEFQAAAARTADYHSTAQHRIAVCATASPCWVGAVSLSKLNDYRIIKIHSLSHRKHISYPL
jgi:hypothetical protein